MHNLTCGLHTHTLTFTLILPSTHSYKTYMNPHTHTHTYIPTHPLVFLSWSTGQQIHTEHMHTHLIYKHSQRLAHALFPFSLAALCEYLDLAVSGPCQGDGNDEETTASPLGVIIASPTHTHQHGHHRHKALSWLHLNLLHLHGIAIATLYPLPPPSPG